MKEMFLNFDEEIEKEKKQDYKVEFTKMIC